MGGAILEKILHKMFSFLPSTPIHKSGSIPTIGASNFQMKCSEFPVPGFLQQLAGHFSHRALKARINRLYFRRHRINILKSGSQLNFYHHIPKRYTPVS